MSSEARFLFLGCSTSVGVPVIGCDCEVCLSSDPKNHRTRSSVYLEGDFGSILVDSGPDLHQQALRENLRKVDSVLYTHPHVDHVAGFDELRAFCWRREDDLPLYGSPETLETLKQMYPWAFAAEGTASGYVKAELRPFEGPFEIGTLTITPVEVEHGRVRTHGFRFDYGNNSIAYISDVKTIPESSMELIKGVQTLVIDGLRYTPHPTHMNIEEAVATSLLLEPKQTYLTHLGHEIDYERTNAELPENIHLAYDGLTLTF